MGKWIFGINVSAYGSLYNLTYTMAPSYSLTPKRPKVHINKISLEAFLKRPNGFKIRPQFIQDKTIIRSKMLF